jgi:hypothetical protein
MAHSMVKYKPKEQQEEQQQQPQASPQALEDTPEDTAMDDDCWDGFDAFQASTQDAGTIHYLHDVKDKTGSNTHVKTKPVADPDLDTTPVAG